MKGLCDHSRWHYFLFRFFEGADDGEGGWWTDWYIWRIVAICDMHEYGRVFATFVTFDDFARVA